MLYEHWGENRSGKTAVNAMLAWFAYLKGRTVYCNCPTNPLNGRFICILNFPHRHLDAVDFFDKGIELTNCYIMTDQGETSGLDSLHITRDVKEAGYFAVQAAKRDVDWHYDTVRHKSILVRIRTNAHFYIKTERIPLDPRQPLRAIRVRTYDKFTHPNLAKRFYITQPKLLFPLFNSTVLISPVRKTEIPNLDAIHKQLVGP